MIIDNDSYSVYIHINRVNGKMYVGITSVDPKTRWKKGKAYHENTHLYKAFEKYGWENFDHDIIASNLTREEALKTESFLIDKLDLKNPKYGYNMIDGGSMPPIKKGINHPNFGRHLSDQTKQKISNSKTGISHGKHSEETKNKISLALTGKSHPCSEERKQKVSEHMKGSRNPRAKKVICIELGIIFNTAQEASLFFGKSKNAVASSICSRTKMCGYTWKYL